MSRPRQLFFDSLIPFLIMGSETTVVCFRAKILVGFRSESSLWDTVVASVGDGRATGFFSLGLTSSVQSTQGTWLVKNNSYTGTHSHHCTLSDAVTRVYTLDNHGTVTYNSRPPSALSPFLFGAVLCAVERN